jgi:hypothetical protein
MIQIKLVLGLSPCLFDGSNMVYAGDGELHAVDDAQLAGGIRLVEINAGLYGQKLDAHRLAAGEARYQRGPLIAFSIFSSGAANDTQDDIQWKSL